MCWSPPARGPVVVEDDAFVGGGCGLYDGVIVGAGAVLGAGVILTGQSRLIDLVEERELRGTARRPAGGPAGCRGRARQSARRRCLGRERGVGLSVAVIVKRRDATTSARVALEEALR